uniref:Uncharacterized protein n=1 Tax=Siphoviridae sp. ctTDf8 TaxID=2825517 RepID=A0A8S5UJB7_9CAUD|nr:MAG TPA: hypothetical protein [Siphoviridae sp. ctTDf8]
MFTRRFLHPLASSGAAIRRYRRSRSAAAAAGAGVGDGGMLRRVDPLDQKKNQKNTKNLLTIAVTCAIIVSAKDKKLDGPRRLSLKVRKPRRRLRLSARNKRARRGEDTQFREI